MDPLSFISFLKWYLVVLIAGVLALPLAFRFFKHLPDRGYAFIKPLGLLTIGYAFWLLGSFGFLRNDVTSLLLAAALVAGIGLFRLKRPGLAELRDWLRSQLPTIIAVEIVFLVAFAALAWFRAYNPDVVATEKPMEFMFINSIMRSPAFPPNDAWLSGHAISYYYFGYVLIASLARLTGTPTAIAFNLGLALLFALAAVGSLGVVLNLVALVKRGETVGDQAESSGSRSLLPSFWPALLGPLFVLIVGNFYGLLAVAHVNGMFPNLNVWAPRYDFGQEGGASPHLTAGWINVWQWLDLKGVSDPPPPPSPQFQWDPGYWWWFNGARVIHDKNLTGVETEAIDEMPAFSFILGDMHPHVLSLPFVILVVALALEWLLWGQTVMLAGWDEPGFKLTQTFWPLADRLLLSAVILGGLGFLNTWDLPIYWFLTSTALVIGLGLQWGWATLLDRWRFPVVLAVLLGLLSVILYLPFFFTFQSQAGGILPNIIYPTRFQQTFVMFGPVLIGVALFIAWLTFRGRARLDQDAALWSGGGLVVLLIILLLTLVFAAAKLYPNVGSIVDQALYPLTRQTAFGLIWQRRLMDSLATIFPAVIIGLAAGLGVGALRGRAEVLPENELQLEAIAQPSATPVLAEAKNPRPWRKGRKPARAQVPVAPAESQTFDFRSPAVLLALAMALTGALLLIGPEFLYLRDDFGTRMNTLFKFYFQAWVLWGLTAAFGTWLMLQFAGPVFRWIAAVVMALAILGGMVYTVSGVYSKGGQFKGFAGLPSLDGMAYFARDYPDDWAAVQWLQKNVPDAPVIAEGIGGQYWIEGRFSRISMATGLPTVMGWPGHESQWRGRAFEKVAEREEQIRTLYQVRDWNTAQSILDKYHIEYVYLSQLERDKYKPTYLPKFDQNMRVVFQAGDVTIYQRQGAHE
jgi:YYY domain-containing protein